MDNQLQQHDLQPQAPNNHMSSFSLQQTISKGQLLHPYEKHVMGDVPEGLPDDIRDSLTAILKGFDERSNIRRNELIAKIRETFATYVKDIGSLPDMDQERKEKLLAQSAAVQNSLLAKLQSK